MEAQRYRSRRFILRKPRARAELAAAARLQGWAYVGERPGGAGKMHITILETAFPGISVWYFEQEDPAFCGVTVDSTLGPDAIETVATLVQGMLVPWMLTELLDEMDNASDRILALRRAGLGAPDEADPAFLARFSSAAADPDPAVRTAAIYAMTDTGWQECGPVMGEMARTDSERAVREFAGRAVEVLPAMRPKGRPVPVSVPDLFPEGANDLYRIAMQELAKVIDGPGSSRADRDSAGD
ncbi:hypothetical protein GCM10022214_11380 [Actinomadura miaoliensis]|uniref:HEAT repeat domain-containing protein n=2 Tax=Actinomadura miaoliensis TaxID=430685 RepID=A0ABP7V661_9ACTN